MVFYGMCINTLILILTVVTLFFWWMKRKLLFWSKQGLETPPIHFLFGNFKDGFTQKYGFGMTIKNMYDYFRKNNLKHGGMFLSFYPIYIPVDLDIVKSIMQTDFEHFVDRGVYVNEEKDPLSAHLFSLEGNKWKHLRHKLSPTFTSGKLKMMFETIVNCTKDLTEVMNNSLGTSVDIKDVLARFTTDTIGSCAFGIECNSLRDPDSEFRTKFKSVFENGIWENLKGVLSLTMPDLMKSLGVVTIKSEVSKFFLKVVDDTVHYRETNKIYRKDFMHSLIQLKNLGHLEEGNRLTANVNESAGVLTFNEVAAQAYIFFLGGFETSSTTMTFCLFELASNQEIQNKLRQEIVKVLNRHDGKLTYEAMMEMVYMEQVINETLRKYPPLPTLNRVCTKDYQVPDTNFTIKKGTKVFIPVYGIQHDEEYYPNPEKFDPDRFSEENKNTRPINSFLPFGEGPRICIGLRFGMIQTKVGLTALLRDHQFSVSPKTKQPLEMDPRSFILTTEGGMWLDFEKLDK